MADRRRLFGDERRWQIERRRWRVDLGIALCGLLLGIVGIYLGFFRGGSAEQLSMSFVNRIDLVPEQVDHSRPRAQMEALIRNVSDHEITLTFVGFDLVTKQGEHLSIGNAEPVPPARPISGSSGFTLAPGVGQIFYVNVPIKTSRHWFEPGTKAAVYALTSDGGRWSSKPTTDFFYVIHETGDVP